MPILFNGSGGAFAKTNASSSAASGVARGSLDETYHTRGGGGRGNGPAARYVVPSFEIPPFRGATKDDPDDYAALLMKGTSSGSDEVKDSGGRAHGEDFNGSVNSLSSVGVQSSFVQGQIEKQKRSGNWSDAVAPDA